jgi:uncharacterized protein (DUF1684 family)
MRRLALSFIALLSLSACVADDGAVGSGSSLLAAAQDAAALKAWEQWKADENAAWSTKEFAILKIDDAVYLNEGQGAVLKTRADARQSYRWEMGGKPRGAVLSIRHEGGKAVVVRGKTRETFNLDAMQRVAVAPGIDIRFGLTQVSPGVNGLRVMVYNQAHPEAKAFEGLKHFAHDARAVVEAKVELAPSAEAVDFQTSRGWLKRINRVATASFTLYDKPVKLGLYSDDTDPKKVKRLSAFFLDELSGGETYGVGRYLDVDVDGVPETLTIDFNRAYNPNCARSPHYNCPVAVEKIPVALRAGEMAPD